MMDADRQRLLDRIEKACKDDGEALRLAVDLRMDIELTNTQIIVVCQGYPIIPVKLFRYLSGGKDDLQRIRITISEAARRAYV